jgi:phosphoglycolate phosphatase
LPRIVLFDIDGTLVLSGGAGRRAMVRAFDDIFAIPDALRDVSFAGRTDAWIFADAARRHGLAPSVTELARLRDQYLQHLAFELQFPGEGIKGLMPGVRPLLDELAPRSDAFLALLTGNFEMGARAKLEYFDLWRYFRCGAFGDRALDRNHLVPEAVARVRECGGPDVPASAVVVVGDTPLDVACAAAAGARSVAVATGGYDEMTLEAAGADVILADFTDLDRSIAAILE